MQRGEGVGFIFCFKDLGEQRTHTVMERETALNGSCIEDNRIQKCLIDDNRILKNQTNSFRVLNLRHRRRKALQHANKM